MNEVWKWPLSRGESRFLIPAGAKTLSVQVQHGTPSVWMIVDPRAEKQERVISCVGTGMSFDHVDGDEYIGTVQLIGGAIVLHYFLRPVGAL